MLDFAEFLPDQPDFNGGAGEALNVFPSERGYRPMPALAAYSTTPLTARAQGAAYFRNSAGDAKIFAGDATKLYLLTTATWGDVSRVAGGAYATSADDQWDFAQFGATIIAVNGTDVPQKFTLDSSSNFAALGGSPPTGPRFVEIMGDFVVMARLPASKTKVQWSAINNAEDYVASATTQSDSQTIPDGGDITGLFGFEYGGLVFQERAIRRMDYEGSPVIFRFKKIADGIGATIAGSVAGFGDRAFFVHRSGIFEVIGAAQIQPIGAGKVDRFFWSDIDTTYLTRVTSAVDPVNKLYGISYCGAGTSSGGTPNRILIYHWDTGRWSRAQPGDHEMIWSGTSQTGITLDALDSYSSSLDALAFSLDSSVWTGVAQPLFSGFDTSHNIGYFNGSNLAATIDTTEGELSPGRLTLIRSVRSAVEASASASITLALGTRNRLNDQPSYGSAVAQDSQGKHDFLSNYRYQRARMQIAAAAPWTHALGVDVIDFKATGRR